MNLLSLYHHLPLPLKQASVYLRGLYLRWWRYGPETERIVAEALARECWTGSQWQTWQAERLAQMLWHAEKQVPFYREQWQQRRRHGDRSAVDRLDNWPVLRKETVRQHNRAFLPEDARPGMLYSDHTSGTTGTPVHLWFSRETLRQWYGLGEARWRRWYNVSGHDRWAILGGQLIFPASQTRPPYGLFNPALNQLYLSSYHIAGDTAAWYASAMEGHAVRYLLGYPSAIYALAYHARSQDIQFPALQVVISNAEPLLAYQRDLIQQVFHCPVFDTYGMTELVCAASECQHGGMHLWPEVGVLEVLDDQSQPAPGGVSGSLICTGLLNPNFPLIRYDTGDRGYLNAGQPCACQRSLPLIGGIDGRQDDVILTRSGRKIGRMDPVFKADFHIREAQIIQESLDDLRILVVPGQGYSPAEENELASRILDRVGPMKLVFEHVDTIERGSNGKFKAVVSHVTTPPGELAQ